MENEKLGEESAFPDANECINSTPGMSKRFYTACCAMQGIAANPSLVRPELYENLAKAAFKMADELLLEELK